MKRHVRMLYCMRCNMSLTLIGGSMQVMSNTSLHVFHKAADCQHNVV